MAVVVIVTAVVRATFWCARQLAVQAGGDERFHRRVGLSGPHLDAVLGENVESTLTNAADNDNVDSLFTQPTRKQTWRVRRCRHGLGGQD